MLLWPRASKMCKMAKKIDIFCLSPLCKGSSIVEEGNRSALDGRGYADPRLVIGSLPLRTTIRNGDKEEVCYTILSGRLADVASCKQLGPEAVTFYDAQDSKFACKAAEKKTQLLAEAGARDLNIAGLRNIQIHPQIQPKYSLARCRPNTPKYRQINDVEVFACACIRLTHRIPEAWLSVCFAVRPCLRRASPAAARARLHGPCGVARGGSGGVVCALGPPRRRRTGGARRV